VVSLISLFPNTFTLCRYNRRVVRLRVRIQHELNTSADDINREISSYDREGREVDDDFYSYSHVGPDLNRDLSLAFSPLSTTTATASTEERTKKRSEKSTSITPMLSTTRTTTETTTEMAPLSSSPVFDVYLAEHNDRRSSGRSTTRSSVLLGESGGRSSAFHAIDIPTSPNALNKIAAMLESPLHLQADPSLRS